MPRYMVLLLLLIAVSCKNKTTALAANEPVSATDFFAAFTKLKLPLIAADTNFSRLADTTLISYEVLQQFVPDSALKTLAVKQSGKLKIHPAGKIENVAERYLLVTITDGKKTSLITYLFDKKQHYLNHLLLLGNQNHDGYVHSVNINTEPTFLMVKEKTEDDRYSYTKKGFAYSNESKGFTEVINESNEDLKKNNEILNPIDTLGKKNKLSGDYTRDKKNFISVRDGSSAKSYIFFLHFEKNEGDCTGELKGTLKMVDETKAVFQQNGDPCVIDFTFGATSLKVKERGSCGNHRGMTCLFDDSYKKKKEATPRPLKGSLKAHSE